jgi:hypothetical protein
MTALMAKRIPMPPLWELHQLLQYNPNSGHLRHRAWKRRIGWVKNGDKPHRRVRVSNEEFSEHRVIWFMQTGVDPQRGAIVHINGDATDNHWDNLKFVPNHLDSYVKQECSPPLIEHPCATTFATNKVFTFGTLEVTRTASGTLIFTPRTRGWIRKCAQQPQRLSA